ncbi:MAG: hypothetical protein IJ086_16010 [Clostridium sp.]|nr:hypothetical protein [Clostridium sp.]MBQ9000180.1 hypothetical protein [Clostridium sp.]
MIPLKLNLDLSKQIMLDMEEHDEYIQMKDCYKNTFKAISFLNYSSDYNANHFKIAYGFVDKKIGNERLYFRHAFIICTEENSVVDVTSCLWSETETEYLDYDYYIFKEYLDIDEYTDALFRESGVVSLNSETKIEEVNLVNKLTKKNLTYNPFDFLDLMREVYGNKYLEGMKKYEKEKVICI